MTKPSRQAIIIGAGIAGPVAAIFLRKAGIDARVFEAWPCSKGIGGGLQIALDFRRFRAGGLSARGLRVSYHWNHGCCNETNE